MYYGIPTYKRAAKQPTLEYLERLGIPKEQIIMSVQNKADQAAYKRYEGRVGHLIYREGHNLAENRNTILDYLPAGERVVIFDDDIKVISRAFGPKTLYGIESRAEFEDLMEYGFAEAERAHTVAWSVYPVHNAFFMTDTVTRRVIGEGTLLGIVNTKGLRFDGKFSLKEDYEFSCRVIRRYGAMPRLNAYACNAPHYTTAGGCKEWWDDKSLNYMIAYKISKMYPDVVELNPRDRGEIRMKR